MRKSHILAKSTPTLTQSGLLAVLLQRQHDKMIELAQRHAHRSQSRSIFSSVLNWLSAPAHAAASARPFHRGVGLAIAFYGIPVPDPCQGARDAYENFVPDPGTPPNVVRAELNTLRVTLNTCEKKYGENLTK